MKMLVPLEMADEKFITSNIAEQDHPEWEASRLYQEGDQIILQAEHKRYEALQQSQGIHPLVDNSSYWLELGATNRWRVFDQILADPAVRAEELHYQLKPGQIISAVALFGLAGGELIIRMEDPDEGVVFEESRDLVNSDEIIDWYAYFFAGIKTEPDVLIPSLPPYPKATLSITLRNPDADAKIGQIVMGEAFELGETLVGTGVSFEDYSRKERDAFGRAILVERAYAELVDFDFSLPIENARYVKRLIAQQRAKPSVFYAAPDRDELGTLVYGISGPLRINFTTSTIAEATLEVEGLV